MGKPFPAYSIPGSLRTHLFLPNGPLLANERYVTGSLLMPNPFIEIIEKNPADFSFGLMGVPMALAAANIARPVATFDPNHVGKCLALLLVLCFEFGVAMLLCVYALDKAADIWKTASGRWCLSVLMLVVVLFSLVLIIISVIPPCAQILGIEIIQVLLWSCMALLLLLCGAFVRILKQHMIPLVIFLVVVMVVMSTSTIIWPMPLAY